MRLQEKGEEILKNAEQDLHGIDRRTMIKPRVTPDTPCLPRHKEMSMEAWTTDHTAKVGLPPNQQTGPESADHDWIVELREGIDTPGQYLAYRGADGNVVAYTLEREWTRIGRSLAADIRFDDPTVSRRHALIVRQPDGLRVVDDRSLNGVFVNGERVEWSALADGDEIVIGRHHLHFCDVTNVHKVGASPLSAPEPV
jgi:hypothetical protein